MAPWFKYSGLEYKTVEDKEFDNESTDEEILTPKKRKTFSLRTLLAFVGGLAFGVVLPMAFKSSMFPKKHPVASRDGYYATKVVNGELIEGTQCGDSWQEAKALGCIYDKMASRWYAPECFDKESFDAMMMEPGTNFTWFSDFEHTIEVPAEIAQHGEFELLYPLYNFHKIHCLYLWRKMHHSLLNNLPLDDDLMEEDHTVHCTKNLLTWADPTVSEVASIAHAGRPFCRRNPLGVMPLELV
ncbi:uncharacterized protein LY89DRAFT_775951 [Mollisia scopiformis]|uniref:Uncharacterized protein n=1 Tax=Mollisia scopiformis TaxID=149040 RepID=A0A194XTP0_MOLSC|nr:uncharacterized protein LY89DRAFT_775951 [Mollisia scopiformis]KUJ23685.1 hypothetical protein LY89DRAFT_775951 [Mollisia scopiformis]